MTPSRRPPDRYAPDGIAVKAEGADLRGAPPAQVVLLTTLNDPEQPPAVPLPGLAATLRPESRAFHRRLDPRTR